MMMTLKGVKELDIAVTLEHIRDQRPRHGPDTGRIVMMMNDNDDDDDNDDGGDVEGGQGTGHCSHAGAYQGPATRHGPDTGMIVMMMMTMMT